ncbi:MAG: formylglycine-generating enzyme family protein, partial [Planctomycetaceae bacterium]
MYRLIVILAVSSLASCGIAGEDKPDAERLKLLKTFHAEFVSITPGQGKFPKSFPMGSTQGDEHERPVHAVAFDYDFAIAKYEVPQNLYQAVMGRNPSRWQGPRNSVEEVTRADAERFCRRITELMRAAKLLGDDDEIRLPTEAEWEY